MWYNVTIPQNSRLQETSPSTQGVEAFFAVADKESHVLGVFLPMLMRMTSFKLVMTLMIITSIDGIDADDDLQTTCVYFV